MMKTASIITMHCPLNYGAVLQTYGLQTYLENQGLSVNIIDYNPNYIVYDQSFMYVGDDRFNKNLITRWLYRIYKGPYKYNRIRKFAKFKNNELHLTKRFETYNDIVEANLQSDYFFCGSDQIWNTVSGAYLDPAYFLQFVADERRRSSYAASGNLPLTEEVFNRTFPMINQLHNVSMREDVTIASIQPYINKTISHVCDPVFLLEANDWITLSKHGPVFKYKSDSYILIYPMGNGGEVVVQKGYEIANKFNLPLYCISASQRKDKRINKLFNADPYTFINLFANAKTIITNSFHGTSFSIILEKEFWTCASPGSNQRITSLLFKFGLENRIISQTSDANRPSVIYLDIKRKLNEFVSSSKEYIKNVTNE